MVLSERDVQLPMQFILDRSMPFDDCGKLLDGHLPGHDVVPDTAALLAVTLGVTDDHWQVARDQPVTV